MKRNKLNISQSKERVKKAVLTLPRRLGVEAVEFFDSSFKGQGFINNTLINWKPTKSGKANVFTNSQNGILIKTGRLRRATRLKTISGTSAEIVNNTPYAAAHNDGFNGEVKVKSHKRRIKTFSYNIKTRKRSKKKTGKTDIQVKAHEKNMYLPRRRFMGRSNKLNNQHRRTILKVINQALNAN